MSISGHNFYLEPLDWLEFSLEMWLKEPENRQKWAEQAESMIREAIGYSDRIEKLEQWLIEI